MSAMLNSSFLKLNGRRLFLRSARNELATDAATVILLPFADEMNKSRHLFRQLMLGLLQFNAHSFMYDPSGTGDSEGDLTELTVTVWQQELDDFILYLKDLGYRKVSFVAVRFGALQLMDFLAKHELKLQLEKIILWQPILQVSQFLQQTFRLKVAEQMAVGIKIKQNELEQKLNNGQSVEIAGYTITSPFYMSLLELKPFTLIANYTEHVTALWLDTTMLEQQTPINAKLLLQINSCFNTKYEQVYGPAWWNSSELMDNNALVEKSIAFLVGHVHG